MKVDKDTLKKHHFWILLGLVPVFVLAAVLAITGSVGAAIEKRAKDVADAQKEIDGKQSVKSDPLIQVLDKQKEQLLVRQTDLWKENWERQIGVTAVVGKDGKVASATQDPARNLLRWPASPLLKKFDYTPEYATDKNQLKFGEKIPSPNGDEYNQFKVREVYLAEFSNARPGFPGTGMADAVAPTEFLGGWQSVLRHVSFPPVGVSGPSGWGDRLPTSEQIWLALEDIWVQRALLGQVRAVNDQVGAFQRVPALDANNRPVDAPLHRAFASRTWRVELKVVPDEKDRRPVLTGRIKNLTDRLQPFGLGSRLTLNVWLSADPNAQPVPFHISGEFLKGGEEREVIRTEEHALPAGTTASEIARVEQVFDARTVPVRRIDAVALGYKDNRHALVKLEVPDFEAYKKEAEKAAAAGSGSEGGSGGPMGAAPPGGVGSSGGGRGVPPPGPTGSAEGGAGAGGGSAGGTAEAVLDGNRKRYIQVTKQVRRMPVAVTLVVDQAYIQDVLVAYANSPLRFQTTQVHWKRFRGSLGGPEGSSGGGFGPEGGVMTTGPGLAGSGFGSFGEGAGLGPPRGPGGLGVPPGVGSFPPGGPGPMGLPGRPPGVGSFPPGGPGPMGPMSPAMPMGPTGGGPGGIPFGPGGTMTSVSEGQLTAGLVEVTVYGIVSLYEKYQPPADATAGATP